jgi:hypothetical protein
MIHTFYFLFFHVLSWIPGFPIIIFLMKIVKKNAY